MSPDAYGPPRSLRRRAEELLAAKDSAGHAPALGDLEKLAHDLAGHQVELEIQNQELQESKSRVDAALGRYARLYHQSPIGYLTLDASGIILQSNQTFLDMLQISETDVTKKSLAAHMEAPSREVFLGRYRAFFNAPEGKQLEARLMRVKGSPMDIRLTGRAEQADALGVDGVPPVRALLVAAVDISAEKQSEEARNLITAQLHQAQKLESVGRLASGIAHEMNNVLGAVVALASVGAGSIEAGPKAQRDFETIRRAAMRGAQVVKTLLGFARKGPVEVRELDVNALLREQASLLSRTTLARVRVALDLVDSFPAVRGDEAAVCSAVMNLCLNAIDAMPEGGQLTLRTRRIYPDWVEIQVEDTGSGMSEDVRNNAFDPFFTTKPHGKGTGLGLSIVQNTVMAHGGQISIDSQSAVGTRVTMRFPAAKPHAPDTGIPVSAVPPAAAHVREVLAIDDDEFVLEAIGATLEYLGHRGVGAQSGEAALEKIEAGLRPDLVILDMNMPGMGGLGALPRIRALLPKVPILLSTGRPDQSALDLIASQPGVSLLAKPFSADELKKRIDALPNNSDP
jgi:signal transduction histidine kinase